MTQHNGKEVVIKQETEHYYPVYSANDPERKLFSIKKDKDEKTK